MISFKLHSICKPLLLMPRYHHIFFQFPLQFGFERNIYAECRKIPSNNIIIPFVYSSLTRNWCAYGDGANQYAFALYMNKKVMTKQKKRKMRMELKRTNGERIQQPKI